VEIPGGLSRNHLPKPKACQRVARGASGATLSAHLSGKNVMLDICSGQPSSRSVWSAGACSRFLTVRAPSRVRKASASRRTPSASRRRLVSWDVQRDVFRGMMRPLGRRSKTFQPTPEGSQNSGIPSACTNLTDSLPGGPRSAPTSIRPPATLCQPGGLKRMECRPKVRFSVVRSKTSP
jgi:hypothetical protein